MGKSLVIDVPASRFTASQPGASRARFDSDTVVYPRSVLRSTSGLALSDRPLGKLRVGVISNAKAHRNLKRAQTVPSVGTPVAWAAPRDQHELTNALADFAARDINVLVVDGGDGTIRDVITAARRHFPGPFPTIVLVPSGKTNALALDLGIPTNWTVDAALESVSHGRVKHRAPLEIWRDGASVPDLRGFLFGAGAFVRATRLAQRFHGLGAFNGLAVGLSLASAIAQTFFGARGNSWRKGEHMRIATVEGRGGARPFYIALGSTLTRLPLGIKPFGKTREGLKILGIDAPPRHMLASVPALLAGHEGEWLDRMGYHRATSDAVHMSLGSGFILDGEVYPGGDFVLKTGAPLTFAVP